MEPKIIPLEPTRANSLLKWWSDPAAQTLLDCLDKSRSHAIVLAAQFQTKAIADGGNHNFEGAAREKLEQAAQLESAISVLKSFLPDGPFIARIEL